MNLNEITQKVRQCADQVGRLMGPGFLKKVYENALACEIGRSGLRVQQRHPITIRYQKAVVGEYQADLLVENSLLVEIRTDKKFDSRDEALCRNHLKATGLKECLLVHFGETKVQFKRVANR
jgi:GxxExxY protein